MKRRRFIQAIGAALATVALAYVPGEPWDIQIPEREITFALRVTEDGLVTFYVDGKECLVSPTKLLMASPYKPGDYKAVGKPAVRIAPAI